jgi:hypothetical protein
MRSSEAPDPPDAPCAPGAFHPRQRHSMRLPKRDRIYSLPDRIGERHSPDPPSSAGGPSSPSRMTRPRRTPLRHTLLRPGDRNPVSKVCPEPGGMPSGTLAARARGQAGVSRALFSQRACRRPYSRNSPARPELAPCGWRLRKQGASARQSSCRPAGRPACGREARREESLAHLAAGVPAPESRNCRPGSILRGDRPVQDAGLAAAWDWVRSGAPVQPGVPATRQSSPSPIYCSAVPARTAGKPGVRIRKRGPDCGTQPGSRGWPEALEPVPLAGTAGRGDARGQPAGPARTPRETAQPGRLAPGRPVKPGMTGPGILPKTVRRPLPGLSQSCNGRQTDPREPTVRDRPLTPGWHG